MDEEKLLHKLFYTDKNFDGVNALYIKAKQQNNNITLKKVREWLKKQSVVQQTHNKVEKVEFKPIYSEVPNSFQIDLTFFPKYKSQNNGYYILFTAININTRYAYVYYSKERTNENLLHFLKQLENETIVYNISGDLEFKRKELTDFLDKNKIQYNFYKADSHKLGIINRFHRTLKEKLEKYFIANNTVKWIDVIDKIIKNYNNTFHRGIQIEPANANSLVENDIINEKREQTKILKEGEIKYEIGDKIRIRTTKNIFEKNKPIYSQEIYIITKVNKNTVKASHDEDEITVKKTDIMKVDKVENDVIGTAKVEAVKQDKIDRTIRKEGIEKNPLINEPRQLRKLPRIYYA